MNHLKPIPLFPHKNQLFPLSIPLPLPQKKKKKRTKTQVIRVGGNPQSPSMIIRPPCYAFHKHEGTGGMWNLKIQVSKLDPPRELRLYVGASILKDNTKDSQPPLQIEIKTKNSGYKCGR